MSTEANKADFLFAKEKLLSTIMKANGWVQGVVNRELIDDDSVFFYVYDYQTHWTWCCSVPKTAFFSIVNQAATMEESDRVSLCGNLIAEFASREYLDPENENNLAIAVAAYFSITKVYQVTEQATKANHFAIIRYGQNNEIRPFALGGPERYFIPANQIVESMQKVIALDASKRTIG